MSVLYIEDVICEGCQSVKCLCDSDRGHDWVLPQVLCKRLKRKNEEAGWETIALSHNLENGRDDGVQTISVDHGQGVSMQNVHHLDKSFTQLKFSPRSP